MLVPTRRSWRRWPASPASRKKDTETIVDTVFGSIVHALHRGEKVELRGSAVFASGAASRTGAATPGPVIGWTCRRSASPTSSPPRS